MKDSIRESQVQLQNKNVHYFGDHLPHNQYWRFFPEFRESTAYLDIETTALDPWLHSITVITLYDGKQIFSYIQGKNLDDFAKDVQKYSVLVTYNVRRFHVPFMAMYMGLKLNQVHIDLRYILGSLGYTGGLEVRGEGRNRPGGCYRTWTDALRLFSGRNTGIKEIGKLLNPCLLTAHTMRSIWNC